MSKLRAIYRLAGFILLTLCWVVIFSVARIFYQDRFAAGVRWRMFWTKLILPFLGIRIRFLHKEVNHAMPVIYVANHRSYIDPIVALRYAENAAIVAKAELARWPLIGPGAGMAGVLFVQRGNRESRSSVLETMRSILGKGFSLVVFPEGTTTRSPAFLPFKTGAFKLAAEMKISIVPMAIEFEDPDDAWVGDDTFLRHFIQTFRKKKTLIRMSIGPAFINSDAEGLKNNVHDWIKTELNQMHS